MTREEQINQKAKELGQKYFPDENNIWARPNYEAQYVESACKEMIEWADKEVKEVDLDKEARHYLLYEHESPLFRILHEIDLLIEMQYHRDIENAFKAGYELGVKAKKGDKL